MLAVGLLQAAFFALFLYQKPVEASAALYFVAWVVLPASVAAVGFAPRRHFVAAIASAGIASLLFGFLFLKRGDFRPERPPNAVAITVSCLAVGLALATIVGGFVQVAVEQLRQARLKTRGERIRAALRRGLAFSIICATVAWLVCWVLAPEFAAVERKVLLASTVSAAIIGVGAALSVATGFLLPEQLSTESLEQKGIEKTKNSESWT